MPDIGTISAALTSLKTAMEITKTVREADQSLQLSEMKVALADLYSSLADVRVEVTELQEQIRGKDERISELENQLEIRETVVKHGDAYYKQNESGNPTGEAYCLRCWENDHHLRTLINTANRTQSACPTCRSVYRRDRVNTL